MGGPVLYLDYDGVLHHEDVRRRPGVGLVVAQGQLFEHAGVLIDLLTPYPAVRIVLSTSWVSAFGFDRARAFLPPELQVRVVGATTHRHMRRSELATYLRGHEVWGDVVRRGVHHRWVAIDDANEGWHALSRPHLVLSDPVRGLSNPNVAQELADRLAEYCGD